MRRTCGILGLLGLAVVLAGCDVNAKFDITMRDDGTGIVRTTITVDPDAVQRLGGPATFTKTVLLDDLRAAGWTVSPWRALEGGAHTIGLSHPFVDQADLSRRIVDLAGPKGILQSPALTHERGWFSSRYSLRVVVDVREPSVDIVHDEPLAARLRAAGVEPALLQAELASQLKSALHVSVVVHLPGKTTTYQATPGSVKTVAVESGGTDWDRVMKFGIGLALSLLAGLFFLAAGIGARRNRRRAAQRAAQRARAPQPERTPLM